MVANSILTATIAIRIWWFIRDVEMSMVPDRSRRHYSYVVAVILESGMIILVFHTIFAGFMLDGSTKWNVLLSIMGAMLPQIAALTPLLIVVRIGLGRSVEEETSRHLSRSLAFGISPTRTVDGPRYDVNFRETFTGSEGVVGRGETSERGITIVNVHYKHEAEP
ncbi:hypothetical protein V5O48_004224 [Marasmius crinis-equi]|uniref:Uncharacterized protein n=1 Tax=Marasmius crinis-equi TaxID=585013 RepID=A0ABR3FR69_9AGAR